MPVVGTPVVPKHDTTHPPKDDISVGISAAIAHEIQIRRERRIARSEYEAALKAACVRSAVEFVHIHLTHKQYTVGEDRITVCFFMYVQQELAEWSGGVSGSVIREVGQKLELSTGLKVVDCTQSKRSNGVEVTLQMKPANT